MSSSNWGYQPDGYNGDDPPYTYDGNWVPHTDSEKVDLLEAHPAGFETQLAPTGSCVVDAVSALITYLQYIQQTTPVASGSTALNIPSPPSRRFMYYNGRAIALMRQKKNKQSWPAGIADTGVSIRDTITGINTFGLVPDSQCPWRMQSVPTLGDIPVGINDLPSQSLYMSALSTSLFAPARLDTPPDPKTEAIETKSEYKAETTTTLFHVKQCLSEGLPVVFAFYYYWATLKTVPSPDDGGYPTIKHLPAQEHPERPSKNKNFPVHVGLIVAYERNKSNRRFLVKSMLSDIPYFWMPDDWILNLEATEGYWTLRVSASTPQRSVISTSSCTLVNVQSIGSFPDSFMSGPIVAPNGNISTLSRGPGMVDLFYMTTSGQVIWCYQSPGSGWNSANVSLTVGVSGSPQSGAVAAVLSSSRTTMHLFFIGTDGAVWHIEASEKLVPTEPFENLWSSSTKTIIASHGSASTTGGIAATNRHAGTDAGSLQVYWVGPQGSVEAANDFVQPSKFVQTQVMGTGSAATDSNIAAAAAGPDWGLGDEGQESVWWMSPTGEVQGMMCISPTEWQNICPPDCYPITGSKLAAAHCPTSRNAFYVSPTGTVQQIWCPPYSDGSTQTLCSNALARADNAVQAVTSPDGGDVGVFWIDSYSRLSSGILSSGAVTTLSDSWLVTSIPNSSIGALTANGTSQLAFMTQVEGGPVQLQHWCTWPGLPYQPNQWTG